MEGEGSFFEHLAKALSSQPLTTSLPKQSPSPTAAHTTISRSTLWLPSGHALNYPKYNVPTRDPGRKTIKEELSNSASYKSFFPVSVDPEPIRTLAQFRNEFADIGPDQQNILPPSPAPALPPKTGGIRTLKHCQFCKKNG